MRHSSSYVRAMFVRMRWDIIAITLILVCGVVLRFMVVFFIPPKVDNDTAGYAQMAQQIATGSLADDNGSRPPVYPLFLALFGSNLSIVRIAQLILGILTAFLLFKMTITLGRDRWAAFVTSGAYALGITAILYEDAILPESLTTLLLICTLCIFLLWWRNQSNSIMGFVLAATLGVCAAGVTLTRTQYLLAMLAFTIPCIEGLRSSHRRLLAQAGVYLAVYVLIIGMWSGYNAVRFGWFTPTTETGFNLIRPNDGAVQYAPDRYAVVRNLYLRYRDEEIARGQDPRETIFDARPEILTATKMDDVALSRTLTAMSLYLIAHHPTIYARSVISSALLFWKPQGFQVGAVNSTARHLVGVGEFIERFILFGFNSLFLGFIGAWFVPRLRRCLGLSDPFIMVAAFTVLISCVTQAIAESGESARYAVPVQPLVIVVVVTTMELYLRDVTSRSASTLWRSRMRGKSPTGTGSRTQ